MLNYIIWNVNPAIFDGFHIRWYGLFFAIGFFVSYKFLSKIFKSEGLTQTNTDNFTFATFILLVVGLRLGHCLFYEPKEYLSDPIRILYIWEGGLASHGGAIGLLLSFFIFSRKSGKSFVWIASRSAVVIPFTAFCVRMGNLMNSEIYGVATTLPWGFVFVRDAVINTTPDELSNVLLQFGLISNDMLQSVNNFLLHCLPAGNVSFHSLQDVLITNGIINQEQSKLFVDACVQTNLLKTYHPTQIYEALTYLLTFLILIKYYFSRLKAQKPISSYVILAIAFLMIFATRFCFEFIKNNQVDFEAGMELNMGQLLSLPFILCGLVFIFLAYKDRKNEHPA